MLVDRSYHSPDAFIRSTGGSYEAVGIVRAKGHCVTAMGRAGSGEPGSDPLLCDLKKVTLFLLSLPICREMDSETALPSGEN